MTVSKRLRFEILRRDNHKCRYCGGTAPDTELRVDHVVPVALGGSDDPSNLVCACDPCNTGKSSVPSSAPLVDDVASDALRWAKAMEVVAQSRAKARAESAVVHQQFLDKWNGWTYTYKGEERTIDLPGGWQNSVDNILAAGLDMDDLHELVDVTMGTRGVKDEFRYFCGCSWQRIKQNQEMAAQLMQDRASQPTPMPITTRWTEADLDYLLTLEGIEVDYVGGLFECEDHVDGLCENDTLCQIVSAARTRESLEAFSIRKHRKAREAEAINDAADEAEDYVYG